MKKNIFILILFATFMLTFGCSRKMEGGLVSGNSQLARGVAYDMEMAEAAPMAFRDDSNIYGKLREEEATSEAANLNNVERKLVKSAHVRIRVENLETADTFISELMKKYDAYAASTITEENSQNYYSLRVPAPQYEIFLSEMNGMGRLLHRSENTEDVTLRYYDLEGRLETKKELLKTFQSYLGRASNIEEILAVEARISELQYDIEGTGMQLRNLANRVDYATVDLYLLGPAAAAQRRSVTFGEQIRQMFGSFGGFLSSIAVVIIGIVIYGIPILLLVVLFAWLLFGRVGLLKKLWRIITGKNNQSGEDDEVHLHTA